MSKALIHPVRRPPVPKPHIRTRKISPTGRSAYSASPKTAFDAPGPGVAFGSVGPNTSES